MATEAFTNFPATTVPAGAEPVSGTDTWVVFSSDGFPTASTGVTQFHVADTNQAASSELILVTNMSGEGNTTWTVTRGAEGTDPVAHQPGFTITAVITAGWLNDVSGTTLPSGTAGALLYLSPASATAWLAGNTTGTKQFLASTGSGGTADSPQWGTITSADIPVPLAIDAASSSTMVSVIQTLTSGGGKLLQLTGPATNQPIPFAYSVAGDTADRFYLTGGGKALTFGPGNASQDVQLWRESAGVLSVQPASNPVPVTLNVTAGTAQTAPTPLLELECNSSGDLAQGIQLAADTTYRFQADSNGKQQWGAGGTTATDTDLYRQSAGLLQTDGNFTVRGTLTAGAPIAVTSGGTGGSAVTSYAVVAGGTSVTTPLQTVSGLGGAGQVLTSNDAGALPSWQTITPNINYPSANGLIAWTYDAYQGGGGNSTLAAGTVYLQMVQIHTAGTVGSAWAAPQVAGGTAASGESWLGLYTQGGTLIAAGSTDSLVTSSTFMSVPLTVQAGQSLTLPPASYYVAILVNAGAMPQYLRGTGTGSIANYNSSVRAGTGGTGRTTLAGTVTPLTTNSPIAFWAGLS